MLGDNTSLLKSFHALFAFLYLAFAIVLGIITQYTKSEEMALGAGFCMGFIFHIICFFLAGKLINHSFAIHGVTNYRWAPSITIEVCTISAILSLYGFHIVTDMGPQFAIVLYITMMTIASKLDTDINHTNMLFVPILYLIFVVIIALHTHANQENKLSLPIYVSVFFPLLKLFFQQIHFRLRSTVSDSKVNPEDSQGDEEEANAESMQEAGERLEGQLNDTRRNIYMDGLFHMTTFLFAGTVSLGFILVTI